MAGDAAPADYSQVVERTEDRGAEADPAARLNRPRSLVTRGLPGYACKFITYMYLWTSCIHELSNPSVSLAALILRSPAALRAESRTGLDAATAERQAIRSDLRALGVRVARLEGAFPFLSRAHPGTPPAD